jgi:hypothetical protein
MPAVEPYSLEQVELDLAALRGNVDRLSEVLTKLDSTDAPNIPAAGIIHYSMAGQHKYASSDGNYYNTGRLSLFTTGTKLINSTTPATIDGLSCPVAAGTYRIDGIVQGVQGPNAVAAKIQFSGPTVNFNDIYIESNAVGNTSVTDSDLTGALPVAHSTPAWIAGTTFYVRFRGILTFTAAGTLAVQGACTTSNVNTWTSQAACLLDVMPVS